MAKKEKKGPEVKPREISVPSFYANELQVGASYDTVIINFGLAAPTYSETPRIEDVPVTRIVLTWDTAEGLLEMLQEVIEYKKKAKKPEAKIEGKVLKRD